MPSVSTPGLILASASPRRQELLRQLGFTFDVQPADIDEDAFPMMPALELPRRLAIAKAEVVATRHAEAVVLAADTVVALGEHILSKPVDETDARRMLELLSGTTQIVVTGLAVLRLRPALSQSTRVLSAVRMRPLASGEIDDYLATGQWRGKAGGYGIQDPDPFVTRMSGSLSNIVGLPLAATYRLVVGAGVPSALAVAPGDED